jgi:hypothetical protein
MSKVKRFILLLHEVLICISILDWLKTLLTKGDLI